MRTCVWCDKPLLESKYKGHRRREFCNRSCQQKHYLWHKQMKHDADMLTEPYWKPAYALLVEQYKQLERRLQGAFAELNEAQERANNLEALNQYLTEHAKDLQADYAARLRALGVSEQDIQEFTEYWARHMSSFHSDTDE